MWAFTSRHLSNEQNNIHEQAMNFIYNKHENYFDCVL